jgi:uncharacterized membrane protein
LIHRQQETAMTESSPDDHIDQSVQAVTDVHRQHQQSATPLQRALAGIVSVLGRPWATLALILLVFAWMAYNTWGPRPFDRPPFMILESAATLSALLLSALILATQRRDDLLANRRDELTLELALLNERKTAKVIALIEELRRDLPDVADRRDAESERMAMAQDARSMLEATPDPADR